MTSPRILRRAARALLLAFARPASGVPAWSESSVLALAAEIPAAPADEAALLRSLPRRGGRLLHGEAFTILAIGDSVTATGPYPEILTALLERATGNRRIRVVRAAYPGKGTDAALRRWARDIAPANPDLALVMFGLNDQAAGAPVEAYQEQMRWLVERLRAEDDADVVLLEPTPHINITPQPGAKGAPPPEASIFRTAGFGAALREVGAESGAPVAATFDALWGEGGADLQTAARRMWPLYPRSHKEPFSSLVETEGQGDTIHPNARGHLALARAVFAALTGERSTETLRFTGETRRSGGRWVSRLLVANVSGAERSGRLELYPFAEDDRHETRDYALAAGESLELEFAWPGEGAEPCLQVVDYHEGRSRVEAVRLASEEGWRRERFVVTDGVARPRRRNGQTIAVELPRDAAVGRIELRDGGELAFVRYARATEGQVTVDGMLNEWTGAEWTPVGEPVQARSVKGTMRDLRGRPEDCYLRWSFRAGREGVFLAFRAQGAIGGDRLAVYFDPRGSEALGTVGPYYWIDGAMKSGGELALKAGDSSPAGEGLRAAWRDAGEARTEAELFVPYAVMGDAAWPESGDLGISIVWMHRHADGRTTRLAWSEDGYAWTPRWFGVVRRGQGELPWMVRVKWRARRRRVWRAGPSGWATVPPRV